MGKQAPCSNCLRFGSQCDCAQEIWNYRWKHKAAGSQGWGFTAGYIRTFVASSHNDANARDVEGRYVRGPVQRMSDPPFDFDIIDEALACDRCAGAMHTGALECPHCRYMHGADDPPVRKKYATPKAVSETAMTRNFLHPPACNCALCDPTVDAKLLPKAWPTTMCPGGAICETSGCGCLTRRAKELGLTITVTQIELARLLFEAVPHHFEQAVLRAELPPTAMETADAEARKKLRRVFDIMWNGAEPAWRQRAEERAALVFARHKSEKP